MTARTRLPRAVKKDHNYCELSSEDEERATAVVKKKKQRGVVTKSEIVRMEPELVKGGAEGVGEVALEGRERRDQETRERRV